LREERLLPRGDLLDLWDLARDEEELRSRGEEVEDLDDIAQQGDPAARVASAKAREDAAWAAQVAEARVRNKARNVTQRLAEMPARARAALPAAAASVAPKLAEVADEARSWGTGVGSGGRTSPGRQIELGRRLANNPKLRKLGALVGRMRARALALRKRV